MSHNKQPEESVGSLLGATAVYFVPMEPLTNFIGRATEIADVKALLTRTRLLTLTGVGGSGKTRLALRVVSELSMYFEDGVACVELAPLADSSLIVQTVAQALGVLEIPGQALIETLSLALQTKCLLLMLDNCEHVRAACGQLAEGLLQAAPDLQILATSREPLAIPGETTWLIPSLSVPDNVEHATFSVADLRRYDAVALFEDRSKAAQPKFALTEQNASIVLQICHQLDGIPLAIELAATKVRVLTVEQIAARLVDRLSLLTAGNRSSMIPRHQTLRATIDWSYDLLSEDERILLQRLSVFSGGCSLEAVEGVCMGGSLEADSGLNLLTDLVDKSMVVANTEGRSEARYRLLEPIRQYAQLKLAKAGQTEALRNRHLEFMGKLVAEAEIGLANTQPVIWLDKLELEHDNIRAALTWSKESDNIDAGLKLVGSLGRFWDTRGHLSEGREWLEKILQKNKVEPTVAWAKALNVAGTFALFRGEYQSARTNLEQSLAIWKQLGNQLGIGVALNNLGVVTINLGDYPAARTFLEESVVLKRSRGDKTGLANAFNNLGEVARYEGDNARAVPLYAESVAIFRELGDKEQVSTALYNLGSTYLALRDFTQAATYLAESVTLACQLGYKRNIALCVVRWAMLASVVETPELAVQLSGFAEAQFALIGLSIEPIDRTEYENNLALQRAKLSEPAFEAAWEAGRTMTTETIPEVVQKIMAQIESRPAHQVVLINSNPHPTLKIYTLGSVRVLRGDQLLKQSDWTYSKSREMLFYLLSHKTVSKHTIGLDLWPDASPQQLRNNFRVSLYHLRQTLGTQESVVFEDELYTFNRSIDYWFDAEVFEATLNRAQAATVEHNDSIELLLAAFHLYTGDFLADVEVGEWHLARREELRQLYVDNGLRLARLLFADSRYTESTNICRALIAYDSYLEVAHRELMRCYAAQGERSQALRHYHELVELMQDELSSLPSPETVLLYEHLRRGDAV